MRARPRPRRWSRAVDAGRQCILAGESQVGNAVILEHRADPAILGLLLEAVLGGAGRDVLAKDSLLLSFEVTDPRLGLPLQFVRPVSPQFHSVVFLFALWLTYRAQIRVRHEWRPWPTTIDLAFHSNIFWTFVFAGVMVGIVFHLLRRDQRGAGLGIVMLVMAG
jgi:hypothetical protein